MATYVAYARKLEQTKENGEGSFIKPKKLCFVENLVNLAEQLVRLGGPIEILLQTIFFDMNKGD